MNNKKQLIVSIGLTLVLVLMIVGISYAAFQFTGLGKKENTITTGAITMKYTESTNVINMTGALPTTDATGKVRLTEGEYFDFTLEGTIKGTENINWEIAAEDVTTGTKKINGKYIKLYLTSLDDNNNETEVMEPTVYTTESSENTYTGRPVNMMSLAKGSTSTSFSTKYRLRMYVDESYNPQGDGGDLVFSVKINTYGKVGKVMGSKLKAYRIISNYGDISYSGGGMYSNEYAKKTTSIVTKSNNEVPSTAVESWDLSEAEDGSVMAYAEDDGTGNGTYKITIGGTNGIMAAEDMYWYFNNFIEVVTIDLSALDTSNTTDMGRMFFGCSKLEKVNLSSFDTSKVTNMAEMFSGCYRLTELTLSNFDTSNVEYMSKMFYGCNALTTINVSDKWVVGSSTTITDMFKNCGTDHVTTV